MFVPIILAEKQLDQTPVQPWLGTDHGVGGIDGHLKYIYV